MKFTDGYWIKRPGLTVSHPREIQEITACQGGLRAYAPVKHLYDKGHELDVPVIAVTVTPAAPDVIKVRIEHFAGENDPGPHFFLHTPAALALHSGAEEAEPAGSSSSGANSPQTPPAHPSFTNTKTTIDQANLSGQVQSGQLTANISGKDHYELHFTAGGKELTSSLLRSTGLVETPSREQQYHSDKTFIHEQLTMQVGEAIYGLGERFGPVNKLGQSVDMWNADGGTCTEQAYKNVPFYLSSAGYGVLVNHAEAVSFEVGSEINTRTQFSVPGQSLEYFVIYGPTPKEILNKYTALTGRPPKVPAWSYGLWLSTSFKTDYSEDTVMGFVNQMRELDIPLSVLHFDCYWMRPSRWCDFTWDPQYVPDPESTLARYHEQGLKVCVWINPYIAQRSHLFAEGKERGYLLKRPDGAVRQWDHWQAGLAWVDFTNPEARAWWAGELKRLLRQGVDCFKTDFGERVPTDVVWHDGSDPQKMHNYYSYLYNQTVFEAIKEVRGEGEALVFARSATVGGQQFPVHWGGDSEPTFVSMAETLRGGLSLGLSGFGYWSHDMGGFEGKPNNAVYTRWFPFGIFSSHSRLHGSDSYRVPWNYGEDATAVASRFTKMKNRLMPYIAAHATEVTDAGTPLLRHMILEYPTDRTCLHVDTQYLFGSSILVAPVFTDSGDVDVYFPTAGWTSLLDGHRVEQAGWQHQNHGLRTLPVYVPDGVLLPLGGRGDTPDYAWGDNPTLYLFYPQAGQSMQVTIPANAGAPARTFAYTCNENQVRVECLDRGSDWQLVLVSDRATSLLQGEQAQGHGIPEVVAGAAMRPGQGNSVVEFTLQN